MSNHFRSPERIHVLPGNGAEPAATAYQRLKWRRTKHRLIIAANLLFWGGLVALFLYDQVTK